MKISFICTVLNEEKTIEPFLSSLMAQTRLPDEAVIVDGGSSDKTILKIKNKISKTQIKNKKFKLLVKKGLNRSKGRNLAIKEATGEIIVASDGGCILDKRWLEEIVKPFKGDNTCPQRQPSQTRRGGRGVEVVAGFYLPTGNSVLQKILGLLTSVPPEKVNPENFLPSSRSIAFRKSAWEKVGGYPEDLECTEDMVFALKLKKANLKFAFAPQAIVGWPQRENFSGSLRQFFDYAVGDGEAGKRGPHYKKLLVRLGMTGVLVISGVLRQTNILEIAILAGLVLLVYKSFRSAQSLKSLPAFFLCLVLLPLLNLAVIFGFFFGLIKRKL